MANWTTKVAGDIIAADHINKIQKHISWVVPEDYGAVGDGVTDDTTALQAAIDAMASVGGVLWLSAGRTYRITSAVSKTFADNIDIKIIGNGARIDATAIAAGTAIAIGGSRVSNTPLGGNVSKNSDTFTVTNAAGIAAGRILLITSTDLWNPTRVYYYKGELALVEDISGVTITNHKPLYDGYAAATTTVHLLNMPTVEVSGIEIECDDDITALQILYARNPVVKNCRVHGSRYAGIYVGYCLGGVAEGNFVYDVWNGLVTGTSYGISVGTGQGFRVTGNTINGARHAITGGGFEPTRELLYANNICRNSTLENVAASIDLHGNVEMAIVTGNVASSIGCAGINTTISDNIVESAETSVPGILIYQEIDSDYYLISGNRVSCAGATAYGCYLSPTQANINIKHLSILGNDIESVISGIFIQPRTSGATGCSIDVLRIGDNKVTTDVGYGFLLNLNGAAVYTISQFLSSNNVYDAINFDAFCCIDGNLVGLTQSIGDVFKSNRNNGGITFCGTDVRLFSPNFLCNTGGAGNSYKIAYYNTGRIVVANPVFTNVTYRAQINAATEYVENGWHSSTPAISNVSGARLVNFYAAGKAVSFAAAAPVAGTWAQGEIVFNTGAAIGGALGWYCTTAGTPGTWTALPNVGYVTQDLRSTASPDFNDVKVNGASVGTNGDGVVAIKNGTAPTTSPADEVQLFSVDSSDGTATLGLRTEQAIEDAESGSGVFNATHKLKVKVNGTEYWLSLEEV